MYHMICFIFQFHWHVAQRPVRTAPTSPLQQQLQLLELGALTPFVHHRQLYQELG